MGVTVIDLEDRYQRERGGVDRKVLGNVKVSVDERGRRSSIGKKESMSVRILCEVELECGRRS